MQCQHEMANVRSRFTNLACDRWLHGRMIPVALVAVSHWFCKQNTGLMLTLAAANVVGGETSENNSLSRMWVIVFGIILTVRI